MIEVGRLLIALAVLQQTFEDARLRERMDAERPWTIVRDDFGRVRRWLDPLFGPRGLTLLLAVRVAAALALIFTPRPFDVAVLLFGTWAWGLRWRGTINGGSDQMTMVVLTGALIGLIDPAYAFAAQAYVAMHLATSFFVAGVVKIKNRDWRRGVAPRAFLRAVGAFVPSGPVAITLAWSTMAFELLFPFGLMHPTVAIGFTSLGVVFHLANAYWFGLNRFLFAWLAAYPAYLALAQRQWLSPF